jgi:hypothetical protein
MMIFLNPTFVTSVADVAFKTVLGKSVLKVVVSAFEATTLAKAMPNEATITGGWVDEVPRATTLTPFNLRVS